MPLYVGLVFVEFTAIIHAPVTGRCLLPSGPFLIRTLPGNGLANGSRMPLPFVWRNNDTF